MQNNNRKNPPKRKAVPEQKLSEAIAYEVELGDEAAGIRSGATALDFDLFEKLYPLLCRPIPEGFIETITAGDGKPYESQGIRSTQVQIDRLNNVLRPWWWSEDAFYQHDGKVCLVDVRIVGDGGSVFARGKSAGGVDRGSTLGNVYKGSFTNAFKLACARIGIGSEVYIGAVDLDPDVSEDAAKAQAAPEQLPGVETVDAKAVGQLIDKYELVKPSDEVQREEFMRDFATKMGAMGVSGAKKVGEAFAKLTPAQRDEVDQWLAAR